MVRLLNSICLCLILVSSAVAQNELKDSIRYFGGLNTIASDFAIKQHECRKAEEIDWNRNLGGITKRYGYDSVGVISGLDSIVAMYPAYYSDGTEQMIYVVDSAGVGYGYVYVQVIGEAIDSVVKIWNYFPITSIPYFSQYDDNVYVTSEDGRGIIWNRLYAREFPLRAPGEPLVVPLIDTTTGASEGLSRGEYRYVVRYSYFDGASQSPQQKGYITQPVYVKENGQVLLTGFIVPQFDTIYNSSDPDSIIAYVTRTKVNPGGIDCSDSAYRLSTFGVVKMANDTNAGAIVITDKVPDTLLVSGIPLCDDPWIGRDSTIADSTDIRHRYGAPSYLATDSFVAYSIAGDTTSAYGIFYGIPDQRDTLGYAYMCTFIDTITGLESDSGRVLYVYTDSTKRDGNEYPFNFNIGLPRIPTNDSGLVINLYRGLIYQILHDTGGAYEWRNYWLSGQPVGPPTGKARVWVDYLALDTVIISDYFLLGQYTNTDSVVIDSTRFDSLNVKRRYQRYAPPMRLKSTFTHDNKLFGVNKSWLRFSLLDSAFAWGAFDFITLNRDDGDEGVIAFPTQGGILFCKNKTVYNVYQDANGDWNLNEVTGLPGCIAPHSYAKGFGGHYYLSDYGVVRITDGKRLERRHDQLLISATLSNFDNLAITDKRKAVGAYLPTSRQYLLSIGDTVYVYSERADAWSTWSLPFASMGLYGIETAAGYVPGDTAYFHQSGDSVISRYGTSETDRGDTIQFTWLSAPFWVDNWYEQTTALSVWAIGTANSELIIRRKDETGTDVTTLVNEFSLSDLSSRYNEKAVPQVGQALYHSFEIIANSTDSSFIDGLDIFYVKNKKFERGE